MKKCIFRKAYSFPVLFFLVSLVSCSLMAGNPESKDELTVEGNNSRSAYIKMKAGVAFPGKDFASVELHSKAGFAGTGGSVALAYGYRFNKFMSLEASLSVAVNPIKSEIDDHNKINDPDIYERKGDWSNFSFLVGPNLILPFGYFEVDIRYLFGYLALRSPSFKNSYYSSTHVTIVEQRAGRGHTLIGQLGGSIRIPVSRQLEIMFSVDYFDTNPEVIVQHTRSEWGVDWGYYDWYWEKKYNQPVTLLLISAGVFYSLK
jgi:hypothetical protein